MASQQQTASMFQPSQDIHRLSYRRERHRRAFHEGRKLLADSSQHLIWYTICVKSVVQVNNERALTLVQLLDSQVD